MKKESLGTGSLQAIGCRLPVSWHWRNAYGWKIVLKISQLPKKFHFSVNCSLFRQSFCLGHYLLIYYTNHLKAFIYCFDFDFYLLFWRVLIVVVCVKSNLFITFFQWNSWNAVKSLVILWNKLTQLLHFLCTWEPMYQARWFSALLRQVNSRRLFCMQRKLATLQTTFSFCVIWWESTLRLAANLLPCWYKMKENHLQISVRLKWYLHFSSVCDIISDQRESNIS